MVHAIWVSMHNMSTKWISYQALDQADRKFVEVDILLRMSMYSHLCTEGSCWCWPSTPLHSSLCMTSSTQVLHTSQAGTARKPSARRHQIMFINIYINAWLIKQSWIAMTWSWYSTWHASPDTFNTFCKAKLFATWISTAARLHSWLDYTPKQTVRSQMTF